MLDDFTRAQRRRYLGSSDMAALCGKDPWGRTAGDVWAEKTGRVTDGRESVPMTVGTYLEPAILSWTEDTLETPLLRDVFLVHRNEVLAANLDAVAHVREPGAIVEAKTVGLIGRPHYLDEFGEPGTDDLPVHILIQVHHQFAVVDATDSALLPPIAEALVPVLLIGRGFGLYRVEKNLDLCAALVEEGERFWQDHVLADRPPPEAPSLATLRRLKRYEDMGIAIPPELVLAWEAAKADTKAAKTFEEGALRDLIAALGPGEVGHCDLGRFTYFEQKRKAYEVAEVTYRVPRFTRKK
jgi:predicted phage-related endonuclease